MGRRSSTETIAALFVAFVEKSTWQQSELARRCNVEARAIRRWLTDMIDAGVPLEREEDHPHVYWSVPRNWLPNRTLAVAGIDAKVIARLIARLPRSARREEVLGQLLGRQESIDGDAFHAQEENVLSALEDALAAKCAVRASYFSATRGSHDDRVLSVQRVVYGDRIRFVAHCHRASALKWFRTDRVTSIRPDRGAVYVEAPDEAVRAFMNESVDGFRGSDEVHRCELLVEASASRWLLRNLPPGVGSFSQIPTAEGTRLTGITGALEVLARFVAGHGGAIRVLEPELLRARVCSIARATLAAHGEKLNTGAARRNPPSQVARGAGS